MCLQIMWMSAPANWECGITKNQISLKHQGSLFTGAHTEVTLSVPDNYKYPEHLKMVLKYLAWWSGGKNAILQWKGKCTSRHSWEYITKRKVFSFCGKFLGYLPVCRWVVCSNWHHEVQSKCFSERMGWTNGW